MWILVAIAVVAVLVMWLRWNFNHWKYRSIPYVEPTILFGNMKDVMIGSSGFSTLSEEIYKTYPEEPVTGFFRLRTPVLQVKDLELIKAITVTEFASFRNNGLTITKEADPITGRNPFFLEGDEWKEARRMQTRNHTSNKLRHLFGYIEEVKDELITYIGNNLNKKFDAIDFCGKFTTDVVSSCVFGIKTCSFRDENSEFRKYGKTLIEMNWRLNLFIFAPYIINWFRIPIIGEKHKNYYLNLVDELVTMRKKENAYRTDFLQSLISDNEDLSLIEMTSQTMSFFIDGYLTSSTEMAFTLYMIALHPEVQNRLREEVKNVTKIDYETTHRLPYLDAVFNEALRLYPGGIALARVCNQDVTISTSRGTFHFKKGDNIEIPVYAIHRDPDNFPNPLKYNPDRFMENPNHSVLLTFGDGPRACIGVRFAKTQIKAGLAYLVKHFKILPGTEDRELPTINNRKTLLISPDKEMSVIFEKL